MVIYPPLNCLKSIFWNFNKKSYLFDPKILLSIPIFSTDMQCKFFLKKLLYKSLKTPKITLILISPINFLLVLLHSLFFPSLTPFYIILNGDNIRGLTLINLANIKLQTTEYITDGFTMKLSISFSSIGLQESLYNFVS